MDWSIKIFNKKIFSDTGCLFIMKLPLFGKPLFGVPYNVKCTLSDCNTFLLIYLCHTGRCWQQGTKIRFATSLIRNNGNSPNWTRPKNWREIEKVFFTSNYNETKSNKSLWYQKCCQIYLHSFQGPGCLLATTH